MRASCSTAGSGWSITVVLDVYCWVLNRRMKQSSSLTSRAGGPCICSMSVLLMLSASEVGAEFISCKMFTSSDTILWPCYYCCVPILGRELHFINGQPKAARSACAGVAAAGAVPGPRAHRQLPGAQQVAQLRVHPALPAPAHPAAVLAEGAHSTPPLLLLCLIERHTMQGS